MKSICKWGLINEEVSKLNQPLRNFKRGFRNLRRQCFQPKFDFKNYIFNHIVIFFNFLMTLPISFFLFLLIPLLLLLFFLLTVQSTWRHKIFSFFLFLSTLVTSIYTVYCTNSVHWCLDFFTQKKSTNTNTNTNTNRKRRKWNSGKKHRKTIFTLASKKKN